MARDPLLLRCSSVSSVQDEGRDLTLIGFDIVRPVRGMSKDGKGRIEYEGAHFSDLPEDFCPSGPLALADYPDGAEPVLVARRYRIGAAGGGPVFLYAILPGTDFDAETLVGRLFSAEETTGPGGLEPLFPSAS